MLKITKLSASALIFYILFYLQVWGDNHIILYGTAVISVISMLVYCFQQGQMKIDNIPFGIWNNLIMVFYSLITGFFVSYDYSTTVSGCITFAAYSAVCIAICYVSAEEGSFEWVLKVLIALAAICGLYAIFRGADWAGYGRTLSRKNNPHIFAAIMNLGIFSVAYIRRNEEKVANLLSVLLILFFFYSTISSGSRKYLIASLCLIIIWMIAFFKNQWKDSDTLQRITEIVFGLLILFLAAYQFQAIFLRSDIFLRFQDQDDLGNEHRIWFYQQAWEIFLNHPLFGGGYDQFQFLSGAGVYAHSTYAEAIADFGFIGCLLYFAPILSVSYSIMKNAFFTKKNYSAVMLGALYISELFIGVGQIFFMAFQHFIAWTIIFYYASDKDQDNKPTVSRSKYIRNM